MRIANRYLGNYRSSPWLIVAVLTTIFSVGFIDRQVINLLIQPIKRSFGLTDLEVSLLQGAAFIMAYLVASPFFGRWVDVSNRRNILFCCLLAWSGSTALCGFAVGFGSLFAVRSLVGAAEAGLTPAAWSMLSDSFDDKRLGRAMSIYNVGPYIGGGLALLLGGIVLREAGQWDISSIPLLSGAEPWQLTLMISGVAGLPCALLLLLIREPLRRSTFKPGAVEGDGSIPLKEVLRTMLKHGRFYGSFYGGMSLTVMPMYAFPAWLPTLANRQFKIPPSEVGLNYGIVTLASGTLGVLLGPGIVSLLERRFRVRDGNLRLGVITNLIVLVCCCALYFRPSYSALLAIGGVACFFYSMPAPTASAALQIVTPNRMRGLVASIYLVAVGIVGLTIAPVLVAFLTDYAFGDEVRVGDSLAIVCGFSALGGAAMLARSLRAYRQLLDKPIVV